MKSIIPETPLPPWRAAAGETPPPVLSPDAAIIKPELQQREQLRWIGRPAPWPCAWAKSWSMFLFSIPFGGFSIFWIYQSWTMTAGQQAKYFPLFGIPFLLVGLSMFLSPVWQYLKARTTVYAVTDLRAIVHCTFPRYSVMSYFTRDIERLEKTLVAGGAGTLIFRSETKQSGDSSHTVKHGFYAAPDINGAEQQLRRITGDVR
jgi:hypothetical protein